MATKAKNLTSFGGTTNEVPDNMSSQCLTCCEPILFYSIGQCGHREVCHKCSIRMRELYKDFECCICKHFLDKIIISDDRDLPFNETVELLEKDKESKKLDTSGIWFSSRNVHQECLVLFDIKCKDCSKPFKTMKDLKNHALSFHNKSYCEICIENRKVFPFEQVLYSKNEIKKHMLKGDPKLHIKPHPICEYCQKRFYSDEEILLHCEESYMKCFLCEAENILYHYFKTYQNLENHFKNKHFLCNEKECLEKKFVVFKSELDLKSHNVSVHLPKLNMSRSEKKQIKTININFNISGSNTRFNTQNIPIRNSSRPIEMPTFFPDNKQKKIDNDEKTFNLANKIEDLPLKSRPQSEQNYSVNNSNEIKIIQEDHLPRNVQPLTNQTIISRIKEKLGNEEIFKVFRSTSALYRQSTLSASDYYDYYISTVGRDDESISLLIALIDLIPEKSKSIEMKKIIDSRSVVDVEFPSLSMETKVNKVSTEPEVNSSINTSVWSRNNKNRYTNNSYGNKSNPSGDVEHFPTLQSSKPKKPPHQNQQKVIKTVWNTKVTTNVQEPQYKQVSQKGKKGKKVQLLIG